MIKKMRVKEGTWFAVPLRTSGYGIGVIARASPTSGIMLAYFFNEKMDSVPKLEDVVSLKPADAIMVIRVGTLGIAEGKWLVVGVDGAWSRDTWPNKQFIRQDELSKKAWKIQYSDDDQNRVAKEIKIPFEQIDVLDRDVLYGDGAAEIALTRRIYGLPTY